MARRFYLYVNNFGEYVRATSLADAEDLVGGHARRANGPAPRCPHCGKPVATHKDGTLGWQCDDCDAAEHAAECASLAAAEDGGGSEYVNNRWAESRGYYE